jgi:hypothetical protein
MTVDSKGALWAAAGMLPTMAILPVYSLSSYDGKSWTGYPLDAKLDYPIRGYEQIRVDTNGTIWFVTNEGNGAYSLHSYDGSTVKTYCTDGPLSNWFRGIAVDGGNRKWFATGYGVSVFDGRFWKNHLFTLTKDDVAPSANLQNLNLGVNLIEGIVVDRDNTVWVSMLGGNNVASFDGTAWKFYNHTRDATFMPIPVGAVLADLNNVKWFVGMGEPTALTGRRGHPTSDSRYRFGQRRLITTT